MARSPSWGTRPTPEQRITVDGMPVPRPQPRVCVMLNKPRGMITSTDDPHGRKTVMDLVALPRPKRGDPPRLYPVGRLDWDSEGLLLLTNDGSMTQRLTHPSYEHPRSYAVLVVGEPTADIIERWKRGITLDGRMTRFDEVTITEQGRGETWLQVTVHEGRKHLVRRMVAPWIPRNAFDPDRNGTVAARDVPSGKWRYLSDSEINLLRREGLAPDAPRMRSRKRGARRVAPPADRGRYATKNRSSARGGAMAKDEGILRVAVCGKRRPSDGSSRSPVRRQRPSRRRSPR